MSNLFNSKLFFFLNFFYMFYGKLENFCILKESSLLRHFLDMYITFKVLLDVRTFVIFYSPK